MEGRHIMIPYGLRRRSFLGLAGATAGAAFLAACARDRSSSSSNTDSNTKTIDWWHISNTDPLLTVWAELAKTYEAAHPRVKLNITPLENEAFKAKLTTVAQAGSPPDIFSSWGGGVLAQQVAAGLVQEVTGDAKAFLANVNPSAVKLYQIDGKQYGVPFDLGMVGFWYNKELFAKAGVSGTPKTWSELLGVVRQLKAAQIVPIALAGAEKWPAHFFWSYLAIRQGGVAGMAEAAKTGAFDGPDFVTAGAKLKELVDLEPFQPGFLGAKYQASDGQAAIMGNGQAAMELMGQWAPATAAAYSTDKHGIGDKLGFFPFPALEGGKGPPTEVFGGGNGFVVGKNAPPEAFEFLKFLITPENQRKEAANQGVLPVTKGAEDGITDANLKVMHATLTNATGFQLFLDQAYPPAIGQQVNDSVAALIAGSASPEAVAQAITKTAKSL
jgi:raffinose/stachyose/melibiose transport system substrate-binding protein